MQGYCRWYARARNAGLGMAPGPLQWALQDWGVTLEPLVLEKWR